MKRSKKKFTVISLFSGAMGLDLGFEKAGFDVRVVVEKDEHCIETIKNNRPKIPRIHEDIQKVPTEKILKKAKLKLGEATLVIGGPPCQPFSTAGKRLSVQDPRGSLFKEFVRVIKETRPQFFVMENVSGAVSSAVKHIPFYERMENGVKDPLEKLGSAFNLIYNELLSTGYRIFWDVLDASDYHVPQKRKRLIIIGSRDGQPVQFPPKKCDERITLRDAIGNLSDPNPEYVQLPPWGRYLEFIPPGGNWRDLPKNIVEEAMGGSYHSQGGRTGFFRRPSWDEPSPTLVTSPIMKATCLCHPEELRPFSIKEYAKLQQFPDDWEFSGDVLTKYRLIGDAVPVGLANEIAKVIKDAIDGKVENQDVEDYVNNYTSERLNKQVKKRKTKFQDSITSWSAKNMRNFPWRSSSRTPYEVLISELLLKRTTSTAALKVYKDFLKSFGNISELANADTNELEKLLSRIGLQKQRAIGIIKMAKFIESKFNGVVPKEYSELKKVPSVGEYTANAVLSFAFDIPTAIVDSNVVRILKRVFINYFPSKSNLTTNTVKMIAELLLPKEKHEIYNWGLLDIGALVCRYKNPVCNKCPLAMLCDSSAIFLMEKLNL